MSDMSPAEAIFFAALERPPSERAAFLDQACAGNAELRDRIEKMLAAQPHLGKFLDRPEPPAQPDPERTGPYIPSAETAGTIIAGKYKLLQRIGQGGMGTGLDGRPTRTGEATRRGEVDPQRTRQLADNPCAL